MDGLATGRATTCPQHRLRGALAAFLLISDEQIGGAQRLIAIHAHTLPEGAGAAGLAAVLAHPSLFLAGASPSSARAGTPPHAKSPLSPPTELTGAQRRELILHRDSKPSINSPLTGLRGSATLGTVAALCQVGGCGVMAVGRCGPCGRAMCTTHRAMVNGDPVVDRCVECHLMVVHGLPITSPQALRQHYVFIGGLASFPPGVERLVRTAHYLAGVSVGRTPKAGPLRFEPILTDFYPDLAYVCHDYWPGGPSTVDLLSPPWNPLAVAAWFLPQIAATGKPPNAELKGWVTTGNRLHGWHSEIGPPLPAWRLQEGSLSPLSRPGRPGVDARADAYVMVADGRVMLTYDQPCLLSTRGLVSMGVLLWGQPLKPW